MTVPAHPMLDAGLLDRTEEIARDYLTDLAHVHVGAKCGPGRRLECPLLNRAST